MRHLSIASSLRKVKLVEVGPRDGLQNLKSRILAPEVKAEYINLLFQSGLRNIEVGSFVSDSVAQMKNTREVLGLIDKPRDASAIALVGNRRYAEEAVGYPVIDTLAVFTSISETFCQKNNGCDTQKNLARIKEVARVTSLNQRCLRGYISCVFGCPFEGFLSVAKTVETTCALLDMGCYEVSIADTIGTATEELVETTLEALVRAGIDLNKIAIHLHDPRGVAKENLMMALRCGISVVDCATNPTGYIGFGGCPNAPDPSSNIDTRVAIAMLEKMELTHPDPLKVNIAAKYIQDQL